MFRKIRLIFHAIGAILPMILLCIDDPGYDAVFVWLIGSIILNGVLILPVLPQNEVTPRFIQRVPTPIQLGSMFIVLLLCLHPYIQLFKYVDFCFHKDQVVIEKTVCDGFTWSDDNIYHNGVDHLNFFIEVSFENREVSSFQTHTVVYNGDKYIGHIVSNFVGTSERTKGNSTLCYFEKKSTQKLYFNIWHPTNTSWESDGLFRELYYGNLEDYRFVTNIICTYFSDGTMLGHYLFLPSDYYYDENGTIYYKDQNSDKTRYYYYDSNGRKHYANN